ncbi:MAG TPA: HAD-IA family hydrolase [Anaerolineales bacterium]|nr:HAD-IA family hydrolase [Anaerolineales bacterium]HNO30296.1 HAD-IA family hydrolase [Anaerolineales bacterium]
MNIQKIKALCFDVDGTLSDTDDLYAGKVSKFLPRFLFKDPERAARRFVMWIESPGNALLGLADTLGLDDEMVALINWLDRHRKRSAKNFLLIPGVDVMLAQLHGRYPMSVVSARDEHGTMAFLEQYNLVQYFDVIVTGLSAEHTKPYPDPILFAAQKMNVQPQECLMIGDTTVDIRAGRSAGAQTVGVLCGFGEEAELKKFGADAIITDTPQILGLLR